MEPDFHTVDSVPEPAALGLIVFGATALMLLTRRSSRDK